MLLKPSNLSNAAYACHIIMETLRPANKSQATIQ